MLFTIKHFPLLTIVKITIVRCQITSYTAKLLDILTAALRTSIIKFSLIPTIQATINREVKGQIRNVQILKGIINNVLYCLSILYKCSLKFNVGNASTCRVFTEGRLAPSLMLNRILFPTRNIM